jgi:chromosome segregation ATPase
MTEEIREARAPIREAEVPWVVSYLREDIQDLRNEVRENRRSIERLRQDMGAKFEALDAKIDGKIDGLRQDMDAKIKGLDAKIEGLNREMGVQLRWIIGIVITAMLTMTGVFAWIVDRMLTP